MYLQHGVSFGIRYDLLHSILCVVVPMTFQLSTDDIQRRDSNGVASLDAHCNNFVCG